MASDNGVVLLSVLITGASVELDCGIGNGIERCDIRVIIEMSDLIINVSLKVSLCRAVSEIRKSCAFTESRRTEEGLEASLGVTVHTESVVIEREGFVIVYRKVTQISYSSRLVVTSVVRAESKGTVSSGYTVGLIA